MAALSTLKNFSDVEAFRKALNIDSFDGFDDKIEAFNAMLKMYHRYGGDASGAVDSFLKSAHGNVDSEFLKTFQSNSTGISDVLNLTGGAALQMQALDQTLVSLVQSREDFRFLNSCYFQDAFSTLLEFNRLIAHQQGSRPNAWVQEAADPKFEDPVIERAAHNIAFLSHGYSQSRVIPQVRTTEDPEAVLQESAMMVLLTTLAWGIWYGNRDINGVEFNGFVKELEDEGQVFDAEGSFPDLYAVKGLTENIRYPGFGMANQMWMSLPVKRKWDTLLRNSNIDRAQLMPNAMKGPFLGFNIPGFQDENARGGQILFEDDLWLNRYQETVPKVYNSTSKQFAEGSEGENAPGKPTVAATVAANVMGSKWKAGDVHAANKIKYRVAACNATGRSEASAATATNAVVTAKGAVNLVITPADSGGTPTHFDIFRETAPASSKFRLLTRIAKGTGSTTSWQDINAWRPGTADAIIGDFNSRSVSDGQRTYSIAQLLPAMLTKFPPGVIALRKLGGMVELYCGLRIFAPKKFYLIKNLPI